MKLLLKIAAICLAIIAGTLQILAEDRVAPPPGITIPDEVRSRLEGRLRILEEKIAELEKKNDRAISRLLPDVVIFYKAVDYALRYGEFFREEEFATAEELINEGLKRAEALADGQAPWTSAGGLVVRGYRSKLDGSVQPYGLVVPEGFSQGEAPERRLDVWLHGRDNHLTELKFIDQRMRSRGEFTPRGAFVLHPYGRFCNAFKFAGEIDVLEALEHAVDSYPIDRRRLAIRGFSMGGAGCWHLAAHYAGL